MLKSGVYKGCNCYQYLVFCLFIMIGSMCIYSSKNIDNLDVNRSTSLEAVIADWQQTPFTEVKVITSSTLSNGTELF